jgi:hypothetical protein
MKYEACCFYFPYRDINGEYRGFPKDFKMNISNLIYIRLYYHIVNEVDEFTYNWLKVHPNPWNIKFSL